MSNFLKLLFFTNLLLIVYLAAPFPKIPNLGQELQSDLPGDTIQVPNTKAFFTNWPRNQVVNFYKMNLSKPYILLNHPPERAKQVIRDEIQSYYLQEFVFPLKGSLYVNGFEWKNDVFTPQSSRVKNIILVGKTAFDSKVTLRWYPTSFTARIFNLLFIDICMVFFAYSIKKSFSDES